MQGVIKSYDPGSGDGVIITDTDLSEYDIAPGALDGTVFRMLRQGQRVVFDLRQQIYTHLLKMPLSFYDRNPVGRLVTRITSDIEALNELFASGIVGFLADVLILTAITATLLWVNPALALVTLSALPILILSTFIFRNKARKYYRQQRGHLSHLNSFTQEAIQGMEIVQSFHREASHQEEHRTINKSYLDAFLQSVMAYAVFFPIIEILSTVVLAAVIWQGGSQLVEGTLTFGQFYLFWHFLGRFFQPIRDMARDLIGQLRAIPGPARHDDDEYQ